MDFYAYCMELLKRTMLICGLASLLVTAPASGSAFGVDGSAIIELDTTGLLDAGVDPGAGGGGGGPACTPAAEISSIDNGPSTQAGTYTYEENYGNPFGRFEFNSGSFPITWNPDSCGLVGGSLSVTAFKTEASVNGQWVPLALGAFFNGLPARESTGGIFNLDAIDGSNPDGTFHQPNSNATIATTTANVGSTTTSVNVSEKLLVNGSAMLPNLRYVTTATFTVLSDQ